MEKALSESLHSKMKIWRKNIWNYVLIFAEWIEINICICIHIGRGCCSMKQATDTMIHLMAFSLLVYDFLFNLMSCTNIWWSSGLCLRLLFITSRSFLDITIRFGEWLASCTKKSISWKQKYEGYQKVEQACFLWTHFCLKHL